jgi:hypothetical protein
MTPCRLGNIYQRFEGRGACIFRVKQSKEDFVGPLLVRYDAVNSGNIFNRFSMEFYAPIFMVLYSEEGRMLCRNVNKSVPDYTASHFKTLLSSFTHSLLLLVCYSSFPVVSLYSSFPSSMLYFTLIRPLRR